ncbi:hypothetical protein [Streptomyces roseolus]|uniref:hypothetical protein n=1 Tax=Streptomyces roseolus TaxID=67358 RepID=UPI001678B722|nr:hypothetical protein [Streptomyces roseolus]GGR40773.1 hypothetical protein GCM10010282_36800 [Streptomyces roseolus]
MTQAGGGDADRRGVGIAAGVGDGPPRGVATTDDDADGPVAEALVSPVRASGLVPVGSSGPPGHRNAGSDSDVARDSDEPLPTAAGNVSMSTVPLTRAFGHTVQ